MLLSKLINSVWFRKKGYTDRHWETTQWLLCHYNRCIGLVGPKNIMTDERNFA